MTLPPHAYADPRVPLIDDELKKYSVAIAPVVDIGRALPVLDPLRQGSGTCVRIDGRFLVATAAHVVDGFPQTRYALLTPTSGDRVFSIIGGGRRGGGKRDDLDIAWLELAPRAAAAAGRNFLDLARLGPFRDGTGEDVCVYGFPTQHGEHGRHDDLPSYTATGSMWATRALSQEETGDVDRARRLHLAWPRIYIGHNDESYEYPTASGLSGGSIWSINTKAHAERWRPDQSQLIGIEFGVQRDRGLQFLLGQQIHVWLEMLADDVPELATTIRSYLAGARVSLASTGPWRAATRQLPQ